jgi:hypothetical protein
MLDRLKQMKRTHTYAHLSRLTGATELTLIRWIHGRNKISRAWLAVLEARLAPDPAPPVKI